MLEAWFLGNFEIHLDGALINIPARKTQSLLAFLAINGDNHHRREKLAGMLWPENDETAARSKLRYALWQLRNAVGDQYFTADKISIAMKPGSTWWVDVIELESQPYDSLSLEKMEDLASLYQGELLPGFYDDWVFLERDKLRATYDRRISYLIDRLLREKRWQEVLDWAEKWISHGQTPEPAFQALMIAHAYLGDRVGVSNAYSRLEKKLGEDLDVRPSEKSRQVYENILYDQLPDISLLTPKYQAAKLVASSQQKYAKVAERPDPDIGLFVAREKEIAWLEEKLITAIDTHGQVAFIAGDAGQGKTSLLKNFGQRAQWINADLVIAYAACEAFSGLGDPYLPFREILALLSGDVASKQTTGIINQENAQRLWEMIPHASQSLLKDGPDLIESFIPGDELVNRVASYTLDRPDWVIDLEQETNLRKARPAPVNVDHGDSEKDLFNQYVRVLLSLSQSNPLLLILDDLQWADKGSFNLLFHLSRRIEGYPILILGSYRPAGITQNQDEGVHPLNGLLSEFKRKFGELELNLNQSGEEDRRNFIDKLLDSEPNRFDENFRQELFLHTSGQPLFTIELLRQMEEQLSIIKDDQGSWVIADRISWDAMPAKVEAVISSRVDRVPEKLREYLDVASVEGEEFTAELIAAVTGIDEPEIVRGLSKDLDRKHRLVEISEIKRIDEQRLSVYKFRHNLVHKYVYDSLDAAERSYLHEQVGAALEQLYGEHKELVANQLAKHYQISGEIEKAIDYLLIAGRHARRISANEQAIMLLTKGVELIDQIQDDNHLAETELGFQITLGPALVATYGYAAKNVETTFERAKELCEQIGDKEQLAPTLWGLCAFYQVRGRHRTACQMASQILQLAQKVDMPPLKLLAHWMLGITHTHLAEFLPAKENLAMAVNLYDSIQDDSLTFLYGQNPKVTCLNYLAMNLWFLGYLEQAIQRCQEAIDYAEQLSHPYSLTFAHGMAGIFHAVRRDAEAALHHSNRSYKLAKESGFPFFLALGMIIRGWGRSQVGKGGLAIKLVQNGVDGMQAIGTELGKPFYLSLLAEASGPNHQASEKLISLAIDEADKNQDLWFKSATYRLWGDFARQQSMDREEIERKYWRAVEIAVGQESISLILQSAISLTTFAESEEELGPARELLLDTYQRFDAQQQDMLLEKAKTLIRLEQ